MKPKVFIDMLAEHFANEAFTASELSSDFEWITECAESNAVYGYGPKEVFHSNATARELMSLFNESEEIETAILGCARVGYYLCAEDATMVQESIGRTLKELKII